jgi:hypothetical protein
MTYEEILDQFCIINICKVFLPYITAEKDKPRETVPWFESRVGMFFDLKEGSKRVRKNLSENDMDSTEEEFQERGRGRKESNSSDGDGDGEGEGEGKDGEERNRRNRDRDRDRDRVDRNDEDCEGGGAQDHNGGGRSGRDAMTESSNNVGIESDGGNGEEGEEKGVEKRKEERVEKVTEDWGDRREENDEGKAEGKAEEKSIDIREEKGEREEKRDINSGDGDRDFSIDSNMDIDGVGEGGKKGNLRDCVDEEEEENGGTVSAPYYVLTLLERTEHVHISIHPEHNSKLSTLPYLDYKVSVITYVNSTEKFKVIASSESTGRNGCTDDLCLEAGQYLIVPTSSGCALRQLLEGFPVVSETLCSVCSTATEEGKDAAAMNSLPVTEATVTVTVKETGIEEEEGGGGGGGGKEGGQFNTTVTAAYTHLFGRLDVDRDGYLSHCELEHFITLLEGVYVLTEETFAWFLNTFDSTPSGVSLKGFLDCQFHVFKEQNRTAEDVLQELTFFGYRSTCGLPPKATSLEQTGDDAEHEHSEQVPTLPSSTAAAPVRANTVQDQCQCACELTYVTGITATVVVHTSSPHDLRAKPPDAALSALVSEISIIKEGRPHVFECCTMHVHTCRHISGEAFGVSFLVVNTCQETVIFTVGYSGSVNVCSNNGKMYNTVTVGAGCSCVVLHLR